MKIAFNPSNSSKNILDLIKNNKDITFDLKGHNIFARGVEFKGTDTNTWRDIKINNVSIGSNILDLRDGTNTTLTNINGVVTVNSTWRPVVDNLTSDSITSSLSANQGRVLAGLINSKSDSGHNHDDRYLKLTGGTMSGTIYRKSGGSTIDGRNNAIIRQTHAPGGSSWNPIACVDTETGTWTLGHLSSGSSNTDFSFCFSTNADYNAGNNKGNYVTLRNRVGTIALTSEIPNKSSWNYDDRYYTKTESDTKYITDITTSVNKLTFTRNKSNIDKAITVNNVQSLGRRSPLTERNAISGIYTYGTYSDTDNLAPSSYFETLGFGEGTLGTIEIGGSWISGGQLYWRALRDTSDNWFSWKAILDSSNYYSILDTRYYTETEVDSLLSKKLDRVNLTTGSWNPRNYHLAADYAYNGGDLSISENGGKMYVSIDGQFYQNEGQYRVLDTSDVAGLKNDLTIHQFLSNTDVSWYPLIWGGSSHANTSDSTGAVYKSHDKLSWQTSSQTLYATHLRTTYIDLENSRGIVRVASGGTSPYKGIKLPTLGADGIGMFSRFSNASDEGGIIISEDTSVIYNSFDTGWGLSVRDKDRGQTDISGDGTIAFGIRQDYRAYSLGGFEKSGSNNSYVLLGGGDHKLESALNVAHANTSGQSWDVPIQGQHWSRLFAGISSVLHHSSIFSIRGSIGCVVFCQTFLVESNHPGNATIICLFSGSYTQPKMRALTDSNGNVLVDLYWDGSYCGQSSSTQQMSISVVANVLQGSISPITSLTNDDTIPSGYSNTCEVQCASRTSNFYDVTLNTLQANSIKNLAIGGGIYWNPSVESATDGSDAASITLVRAGVAGGTTLVLSQMNDANDTIQFKTNTAARLYHNSYPILTTQNTYVNNHKGYINGTEITQVNNADTVDGWHKDNIQWTGYITSSDTLASYWFKMYDITVTRYPYNDITITFLVSEGYSSHFSIFYLRIRQNGAIDSGNYGLSISLYELVGNLRDKVVAYYNNSTGNVQLWGNTGSRWGTMNYTILKKTTRTDTDSSSLGTLTAQSFSSVQTLPSTGYSKVTMSRVGSVSYSDSTGSVHWNNITNKPSTFNPAAHTHTVFKNNLMIKGTNGVSDSASIHLGIGDSDTGFKWISDGVCQIYANNVAIGQWTSGGMNWFKNPTVNGNKVWNAGNDGSGSGLDADTVDGEHASNFSYTHQSSFNFNTIKNGRIVTFDQSNTDYGWINGFASTHNNYLTSVIFNSHRTSYWYVGYMEGNYSTGKTNGLQEVHRLAFVDQIPTKLSQLTNDSGFITSSASISGNAGSATKLQTARRIWGQSFNGTADVNGTIYINNGNSENGAIILNNNVNTHARISAIGDQVVFNTGSALRFGGTEWEYSDWAGIKYDTVANAIYLGIADGTVFNYYTNKRSNGTLKFPGISNINLDDNAQIRREGSSQSWVNGRNGALLRETSVAGYHALWSLKTTNGSWDFGEYNAGSDWNNIPVLSYITDSNYNSGNNAPTYQIKFPLASGTVALTSNILNPTNYYWANVKISTSSSTTTSPTVHTLTATRICAGHDPGIDNSISCSNWFRSSGNTGWYNTTYKGGWYMSDTSWIRTHNSVGIYTGGQIYSGSSIRMGNILLEHTNEINNITNGGINLNYRNSGNISLCQGGGNVGIGTMSPTYKLDVNGQMRTSGFHHSSVNSDNYMLLAGGGYKSFGGDNSNPIFLGYLNLYHGNDGTISSSFLCLGYSVPFTYTRGGNYCRIYIPDTTHQVFYIGAATASVHYSGGGMDTWTGVHRGSGAWWLHCYAEGTNEVRVKGFCQNNSNNDSWWGGNPLWSGNDGVNRITVCIFGYVKFR